MSDEFIALKGCGSHSCAVTPPVGVGHNGPCRCMVSDYRGQSLVRMLRARIDELYAALATIEKWEPEDDEPMCGDEVYYLQAIAREARLR